MHKINMLAFWSVLIFSNFCMHGSHQELDQETTSLVQQAAREGHNSNLKNGLRIVADDPKVRYVSRPKNQDISRSL